MQPINYDDRNSGSTGAETTAHCDNCATGAALSSLVSVFPLTTLVDRDLVTGIKDSKVIALSEGRREHDLIHWMWDQQPVGTHGRWDHSLPEDCYQQPVYTTKMTMSRVGVRCVKADRKRHHAAACHGNFWCFLINKHKKSTGVWSSVRAG